MNNEKVLLRVWHDDELELNENCVYYQYSDGLFDWFYDKLRYWEASAGMLCPIDVDLEYTREDNRNGGCRIWDKDGGYIKFTEQTLYLELDEDVADGIIQGGYGVTLDMVVDYYYDNVEGK